MSAERTRPQSRRNSVTLTGSFFRRSIENVNNKTKVFGVFTLLTAAIVVGMSIYVVHYKELRFNANGRNLVNDQNELMYTANPTTAVSGLRAMLALTSDQLRAISSVAFFVAFPDGNAEVILRSVNRIERHESGLCRLFGADGTQVVAHMGTRTTGGGGGAPALQANYTDNSGLCTLAAPCAVIDGPDSAAGRRLQLEIQHSEGETVHGGAVHGRRTFGWEKSAWNAVFETQPPEPAATVTVRPRDRPYTQCTWWCPSTYTRRDISVGPACSYFAGGFGKCVDTWRYAGEVCRDTSRGVCQDSLKCEAPTVEERQVSGDNRCHS